MAVPSLPGMDEVATAVGGADEATWHHDSRPCHLGTVSRAIFVIKKNVARVPFLLIMF